MKKDFGVSVKFAKELCAICLHPAGIHNQNGCWSYGYAQDPKCRKKCKEYKRDNLRFLEREFTKRQKSYKSN